LSANVLSREGIRKVIEETPSPLMTPELRDEMGKFAIAAAKAVNYEGARDDRIYCQRCLLNIISLR